MFKKKQQNDPQSIPQTKVTIRGVYIFPTFNFNRDISRYRSYKTVKSVYSQGMQGYLAQCVQHNVI